MASSTYTQDYLNFLTRTVADTLYCKISDGCGSANETIMYVNLESHKQDTVYYYFNDTYDDINVSNYTIFTQAGVDYIYTGDILE